MPLFPKSLCHLRISSEIKGANKHTSFEIPNWEKSSMPFAILQVLLANYDALQVWFEIGKAYGNKH